jgi:hypothetical protein
MLDDAWKAYVSIRGGSWARSPTLLSSTTREVIVHCRWDGLASSSRLHAQRYASPMPDAQLVDELIAAAERLIDESVSGIVDGDDVARAIHRDPSDPRALMHHAFREIERLGVLRLDAWAAAWGFPMACDVQTWSAGASQ